MALKLPVLFDELNTFQKAIWQVFEPIQEWHTPDVQYEFVFNIINQQYQVLMSGWQGNQRLYGVLIHIAIRDGLVWLEEDNTKLEVAAQLVEYGIPKDKIVLGFYPPDHRTIEGFAHG